MKTRSGLFLHVVPAALYVFAIFYGGLMPAPQVPGPQFSAQDKVLHAIAFGIMAVVLWRALRFFASQRPLRTQLLWSLGLASALGGLLELVQMTTAYRSAELLDWVADTFGAWVAVALIDWRKRREPGASDLPADQ